MTGMYVLTFGAVPLLMAALLFAYCSKNHRVPPDWNSKTANRKMLPYVSASKRLPFTCLRHLVVNADDGDSNRNCNASRTTTAGAGATATRPHPPRISTVSTVVDARNGVGDHDHDCGSGIYSEPSNAAASSVFFYGAEPVYETVAENAYVNAAYVAAAPRPRYADPAKSRLKKTDIVIANLTSTTNSQVNSYLRDGVWVDPKK